MGRHAYPEPPGAARPSLGEPCVPAPSGLVVWGPPGKHSPLCDQVPASVGHAAASSPSLWAGYVAHGGRRPPQPPSVEYGVGTAEPSPGSERPSLPLQPSALHLGRWVLPAVGTADPCVGRISAPPRLAGEAFPGHPDYRAPLACCPLPGQSLSSSQKAGAGAFPPVLVSAARVRVSGGAPCNEPRPRPCSALGGPLCSLASRGQQLWVLGYWLWGAHL